MVKVLVTGGAGFIGSNFVRWAHAAHPDWHITTLDKLSYAGRLENLRDLEGSPRHRFVKGDIADKAVAAPLVRESHYVVHFAAETHVDRSILAAGEFITTDIFGTFVLLEAAREAADLKMFVQISTDEVYGSVPTGASGISAPVCIRSRTVLSSAPSLPPGCNRPKSTAVKPRLSSSAIANASPSASCISEDVVGARLCGQASRA